MFEELLKLFKQTLLELNFGRTIDVEKLEKMLTLLHVMHFSSFESEDTDSVYKVLDYYG